MDKSVHDYIEEARQNNDMQAQYYFDFLDRRGVRYLCETCQGLGTRIYANTSTWRYGIGGAMITTDICDKCWGSGDKYRKGVNLKELYSKLKTLEREETTNDR